MSLRQQPGPGLRRGFRGPRVGSPRAPPAQCPGQPSAPGQPRPAPPPTLWMRSLNHTACCSPPALLGSSLPLAIKSLQSSFPLWFLLFYFIIPALLSWEELEKLFLSPSLQDESQPLQI